MSLIHSRPMPCGYWLASRVHWYNSQSLCAPAYSHVQSKYTAVLMGWSMPLATSIFWVKISHKQDRTELCLGVFSINKTCMKYLADRMSPINVSFLQILYLHWMEAVIATLEGLLTTISFRLLRGQHSVPAHGMKMEWANCSFAKLPLYNSGLIWKLAILGRFPSIFIRLADEVPILSHAFHEGRVRGEEGVYYQLKWMTVSYGINILGTFIRETNVQTLY